MRRTARAACKLPSICASIKSFAPSARFRQASSNQQIAMLRASTFRAARLATPLARQTVLGARAISTGDKFPSVEVDKASWPPTAFNLADRIAGKKVIICGLPGAFTPT